ncbi:MAG: hypothetical protein DRJ57_00900 [Thermoprotei archaeon]|nr:MAG: hypothetical protein DRJ57_00900 [Thermoprotei archaeon]
MSGPQRKGFLSEVIGASTPKAEEAARRPAKPRVVWRDLEEVMRSEGSDVEKALRLIGAEDLLERLKASREWLQQERDRLRREIESLEEKAEFLERVIQVLDELERRLRG